MVFDQGVFTQPGVENYFVVLIIHCFIIYLFEHPLLERQKKPLIPVAASSAAAATLPAHSTIRLDKQRGLTVQIYVLVRVHGK